MEISETFSLRRTAYLNVRFVSLEVCCFGDGCGLRWGFIDHEAWVGPGPQLDQLHQRGAARKNKPLSYSNPLMI
jgi:hypothetical protein